MYVSVCVYVCVSHINICSFKKTKQLWIILGFKQVKLVSQLHNSKKAICHTVSWVDVGKASVSNRQKHS